MEGTAYGGESGLNPEGAVRLGVRFFYLPLISARAVSKKEIPMWCGTPLGKRLGPKGRVGSTPTISVIKDRWPSG